MKYKAMRENNAIFIDFVHAIFNMYLDEEEEQERKETHYPKIPTKELLIELRKKHNNREITKITGWSYKKINYYVTKYKIGKW